MTGKSFGGCVRYVVQKLGAEVLDWDGVRTDTVASMVADFNLQRKLNPGLEKAVGHIALNWSVHDKAKLSDRVMVERASEYMEKMQITGTQYLIVLHRDREHPHLHIVYNRVNYEGKTIPDRFQHRRNVRVCRELTERHGYYLAPGKGQVKLERLKGADKAKYELHDAIRQALPKAGTWQELESLLRGKGISIDYKYKRGTQQVQGISFRMGELSFKGSSVDRSLSYGAISRQLDQQHSKQEKLVSPGSRQHSPLSQTASPFSGITTGRNLTPGLIEGLLAPATGQAADANDYPFRKKKRSKKKRIRL
ncbi:relaxase/mobilization nuclease domain-containing protein [Pontibacter coccineus]|uniref:relaxase/mobilization nuclease domain-containing protein n=1 Tax=Pontibacter coccineus TaxID=3063328 RepID=UPI0026E1D4DE|nr:relaxase/mobilization nuclease domain-containing protein [Pontibacter sp. BT731]